jgi:hypothetical protein
MTHYEGLLLDFGGVVTTDFFAALGAHCERLVLQPEIVILLVRGGSGTA